MLKYKCYENLKCLTARRCKDRNCSQINNRNNYMFPTHAHIHQQQESLYICLCLCAIFFFFFFSFSFFFFFFLIWVLRPFQEYFTYIEPIVHRRWAKTGEPGEKPPDHPKAELGFPTYDPSQARTTAVRNLMDQASALYSCKEGNNCI